MVSSLTGCRRGGVHDSTGAGPRTTSGVTGPDREGAPAARVGRGARREPGKRTIEPAGIDGSGLGQPAFQHVLPVEMRALPIGCRHRMHDGGLAGLVEAMHVRHRGIEREESIERQRRGLATPAARPARCLN